jgi:hypothetical protein
MLEAITGATRDLCAATSDANGVFELSVCGLFPSIWWIGDSTSDTTANAGQYVRVDIGESIRIAEIVEGRAVECIGRVQSGFGYPLASSRVTATVFPSGVRQQLLTDPLGQFQLRYPASSTHATITASWLDAEEQEFVADTVMALPLETFQVTIHIGSDLCGSLISDPSGALVDGMVDLYRSRAPDPEQLSIRSCRAGSGRYMLRDIPEGVYDAVAVGRDGSIGMVRRIAVHSRDVRRNLPIQMEPAGALVVIYRGNHKLAKVVVIHESVQIAFEGVSPGEQKTIPIPLGDSTVRIVESQTNVAHEQMVSIKSAGESECIVFNPQ